MQNTETDCDYRTKTTPWMIFSIVMGIGLSCTLALGAGFYLGTHRSSPASVTPLTLPLRASSSDSSDTLAMATGPIGEDTEGVFFLDFNTGDLQCLVYYPRSNAFGAHYYTNVRAQLGSSGRNTKYLMVTGAINKPGTSGGPRPGNCLVYVTDVTTGMFAAYAIPFDRTAESAGRVQGAPLVFVQGGPVRNYQMPTTAIEPPKVTDPSKKP